MTLPSRDFLVRQAVLNAMLAHMPETLRVKGAAYIGQYILSLPDRLDVRGPIPSLWLTDIQREYRKLVARFEVVA